MKIILASKSPRRKELLSTITTDYEVIESNFDEGSIKVKTPKKLVQLLADGKCSEVFNKTQGQRCVIGADTIVCINNKILGKPKDEEDAKTMLKMLSGNTNTVLTGVCIKIEQDDKISKFSFVSKTLVKFNQMGEDDINNYIRTGECMDKAGAYAIQGIASKFIENIKGSYSGTIGLPIDKVYFILKQENLLK